MTDTCSTAGELWCSQGGRSHGIPDTALLEHLIADCFFIGKQGFIETESFCWNM